MKAQQVEQQDLKKRLDSLADQAKVRDDALQQAITAKQNITLHPILCDGKAVTVPAGDVASILRINTQTPAEVHH